MDTTGILCARTTRRKLRASIEQWCNVVVDFDAVVDAKRQKIDRNLEELRVAVRERDRAARHLEELIGWVGELDAALVTKSLYA